MTGASAPCILAARVTKHYPVGPRWFAAQATVRALDGVSFALAAGRTLAVVGESGGGKSTLARLVALIEAPGAGEIRLAGCDVWRAGRAERKRLRPLVQMVFQNPAGSLNPRQKAAAIVEEPLAINTTLSRPERRERAEAMLARVGLRPEHYGRYPHMFSGGQNQRIAIARALVLAPQVVVADEPLSALDVSVQAQVLNLLMDLQEQTGVAYLFISHNLAVVRHIADEVLVMYLGKAVEQGSKARIFAAPRHPYTRALLAATPRIAPPPETRLLVRGEPPSPLAPPPGCAFHQRCPFAVERCRREEPRLRPVDGVTVACHRAEEI